MILLNPLNFFGMNFIVKMFPAQKTNKLKALRGNI